MLLFLSLPLSILCFTEYPCKHAKPHDSSTENLLIVFHFLQNKHQHAHRGLQNLMWHGPYFFSIPLPNPYPHLIDPSTSPYSISIFPGTVSPKNFRTPLPLEYSSLYQPYGESIISLMPLLKYCLLVYFCFLWKYSWCTILYELHVCK